MAEARKPTRFAKASDVRKALADMPPAFIHCRNYGHVWAHRSVDVQGRNYEQLLRCMNCTTEKVQIISKSGDILGSTTYYAEGYLLQGLGRIGVDTRKIVRVASLEAFLRGETGGHRLADE